MAENTVVIQVDNGQCTHQHCGPTGQSKSEAFEESHRAWTTYIRKIRSVGATYEVQDLYQFRSMRNIDSTSGLKANILVRVDEKERHMEERRLDGRI